MKTIAVPAFNLRDMIESALLAAEKDTTLPTLCAVRVEWSEDGTFEVVATDRYKLIWGWTTLSNITEEAGGFLLDSHDAKALVSALPKRRTIKSYEEAPDVYISLENGKVTFLWEGNTLAYVPKDGDFPKWRSLFSQERPEAAPEICFSSEHISMLGKVKAPSKLWDFKFSGSHKPAEAFSQVEEGFPSYRILVMPVRKVR